MRRAVFFISPKHLLPCGAAVSAAGWVGGIPCPSPCPTGLRLSTSATRRRDLCRRVVYGPPTTISMRFSRLPRRSLWGEAGRPKGRAYKAPALWGSRLGCRVGLSRRSATCDGVAKRAKQQARSRMGDIPNSELRIQSCVASSHSAIFAKYSSSSNRAGWNAPA
jgi:hypothetical protein